MDNKKLGIILIITSLVLLVLLGVIRYGVIKGYQAQIDFYTTRGENCPANPELCPHEQRSQAQMPVFAAGAVLLGIASLGVYLIFFEKSQKAIVSALEGQKQIKLKEEKFDILQQGLSEDEKKVMKAVREQDGITQQTLRLRADMHKSKLSIVLDGLEKKGLIARKEKGKTKQVFLKIRL